MDHAPPPQLATLVVALTLAFALGAAARWIRLPPLFGYLLAGVLVGPHTPGFVADQHFTEAMAEAGVALLLFGVGLHFRPRDLIAVWRVALPGALAQIAFGTLLGAAVGAALLGLAFGPALVFGLALAISSTAVATRALEERGQLSGPAGRVAMGWLVMQDLVVVLALVLVPVAAGGAAAAEGAAAALGRTALALLAFAAVVVLVGRRALPWLLVRIARTGSRELFTLGVIVVAFGVAYGASALFGVSPALGAFFAGVLIGESDIGSQAAAEAVPLQRVLAALFFVSIGMLLDPLALAARPATSLAALLAALLGTGGAIFALLLLLGGSAAGAAAVAGSLAQIGEFSFLLAQLAIRQGVLPPEASGPILAAAFGAILLTPVSQRVAARAARWLEAAPRYRSWEEHRAAPPLPAPERMSQHAVVIGHGRVGRVVCAALRHHGLPHVVVEAERALAEHLRAEGTPVVWGDATRPEVLAAACPATARLLILCVPDAVAERDVLALARAANPQIAVAARAHDEVYFPSGTSRRRSSFMPRSRV